MSDEQETPDARVQLGLVASLYGGVEVNDSLLALYETYTTRFEGQLVTHWDDIGPPRRFSARTRASVRRRLSKPGKPIYVCASGAEDIDHASAWQLEGRFSRGETGRTSGFIWSVPAESGHTEHLRAFLEVATSGPFTHGRAGRGIVLPLREHNSRAHAPVVIPLAQRFAGLDVLGHDPFERDGLTCINWLTLVGTELLDRLGGRSAATRNLGPEVEVHELPRGVVFQAGAEPVSGDNHAPDELRAYRSVAQALEPIFVEEVDVEGLFTYDDDYSLAWRRRFFRGAKWP